MRRPVTVRAPVRGDARAVAAPPDPFAVPAHHFLQLWLLVISFTLLGLAVLVERGLLQPVFALDRSRVTALIAALVLAGSVHALWHIARCSRRIEATARADTEDPFVRAWTRDTGGHGSGGYEPIGQGPTLSERAREDLLERYADRLRSPTDLGWFLVDVTIRLGLLGTIIGFILIFTSLSGLSIGGAEGLRDLLVAMSGGMGTALFTTLAGLVGATLLSVQYLILGRAAEHLLGLLVQRRAALG